MNLDDAVHEILQCLLDFSATGKLSAVSDARKGIRTLLAHDEQTALHLWAVCIHLQRRQIQRDTA